jgi:hypothetical protein
VTFPRCESKLYAKIIDMDTSDETENGICLLMPRMQEGKDEVARWRIAK